MSAPEFNELEELLSDPVVAAAYCEGRAAAIKGVEERQNPHPDLSPEREAWAAGHASHGGGESWPVDICAECGSYPVAGSSTGKKKATKGKGSTDAL